MSTRTKYTVWVKCRRDDAGYEIPRESRVWEISETPCTQKQADRIAREVSQDFDCRTMILPIGKNSRHRMKITTETIKRYYVEEEGSIYGGPFDTREEAAACLKSYRKAHRVSIRCTQWGNWYGYIGGKKVKAFFRTPEQSQHEAALAWLEAQRSLPA